MSILAAPASVALTRSVGTGSVEFGTTITYTCTSSGGDPNPTIEFFAGSATSSASGPGPTLTHSLVADDSVKDLTMKCTASNSEGAVHDSEILTLFCELLNLMALIVNSSI